MIDIHTHIIPGIDDGAGTAEESIIMAEKAYEAGTDKLILTPHANIAGMYENYMSFMRPSYPEILSQLQHELDFSGIGITLYPGMEIFATEHTAQLLLSGELITLNGSRYVLIEFDFFQDENSIRKILEQILSINCVPIIAHPERYECVQRSWVCALSWVKLGCHLQINKGSLTGSFGERAMAAAAALIQRGLVSLVASDCHGYKFRTPSLISTRNYLQTRVSKVAAKLLLEDNPMRILKNKKLILPYEQSGEQQ